ncbi:MAG: hypothetical protein IT336_14205, partial [Thermomicrobiales bacterium]|nr:hypothetical protein [Thermomicrobiales bacterium]
AAPSQRIRSYITEFDSADGAAAAFAFLEDEGADSSAEDIPTTRPFGEQSELTSEQGISGIDGRPFRSLDLTFRVGGITAGVALVIYRAGDAEAADLATIEALAAVVEARLLEQAADGDGLGLGVVRFVEGGPRVVATYDDAYYRIAGVDVPLVGEADASAALRTAAYADAIDVYQLWQGLDVGSADGALYGVTALRFADDAAAAAWLGSLEAALGENPFYGDIRRVETDVAAGEAVALSYVSGGGSPDSPRAMLVAIRVGPVVARVHLVPQGGLNDVAPADVRALADLAAGCLARGDCPVLTSLPTDPAPGAEATPELDEDR